MTDQRLWFLATPYTLFERGREAAYAEACWYAGTLIRLGNAVFSPIVHTHPLAASSGIAIDDLAGWMRVNRPMMEAAHGVIVAKMDGWDVSRGVAAERAWFAERGRPETFCSRKELETALAAARTIERGRAMTTEANGTPIGGL